MDLISSSQGRKFPSATINSTPWITYCTPSHPPPRPIRVLEEEHARYAPEPGTMHDAPAAVLDIFDILAVCMHFEAGERGSISDQSRRRQQRHL